MGRGLPRRRGCLPGRGGCLPRGAAPHPLALRDTVNKRSVHILLECILIPSYDLFVTGHNEVGPR